MVGLISTTDYSKRYYISMEYNIELYRLKQVHRSKLLIDKWKEFWNSWWMHLKKIGRCFVGLSYRLYATNWNVPILTSIWESMPPTRWVFAKSILGTEAIEHGPREGRRNKNFTITWIGRIWERSLRKCINLQRMNKTVAWWKHWTTNF